MTEIKTIGFIGVGTIGRGMVQNLAKNGYKIIAFNRTKSKIDDLASDSVSVVDSVEETAGGDIVITCLPSDDALQKAVLDSDLLASLSGKILVETGTTSIEMTEKLAAACAEKNIQFMDAPTTGSKLKAESGEMTMMFGGEKALFDTLKPVFECCSKVNVYCGAITYGQRAKLALNMAQAMILESYLECLVFAVKNGVPLNAMQEIMENSAAQSGVGKFKLPYIKKRDFEQHFMLKLMHKDLTFAKNEMDKLGLDLPLAKHIREIFDHSVEEHGLEDVSAIVKKLEKHAGVELKD